MKLIPNFISAGELIDSHKINDEIKTVIYVGGVIKTKGAYDALEIATSRAIGEYVPQYNEYSCEDGIWSFTFETDEISQIIKTDKNGNII